MSSDLFSVKGKTAFVTGSSSGFGKHIAILLARHGANVILAARRTDKLEAVVHDIKNRSSLHEWFSHSGQAHAITMDVGAGSEAVEKATAEAWPIFGRVDILVNNAGVFLGGSVLDMPESEWDQQMNVNVKGVWIVAQAVAKRMAADGKGGSIINIGSCLGDGRGVMAGGGPYAASKIAVQQLTRNMALDLGPKGIRVNAINPGLFTTEMTEGFIEHTATFFKKCPVPRYGNTNHDMDGPILLLASDAGAYMTGSNLTVDGGLMLMQQSFIPGA